MEYLHDTHPGAGLLPVNPVARARVRMVTEIICSGTQPIQVNIIIRLVFELVTIKVLIKSPCRYFETFMNNAHMMCDVLVTLLRLSHKKYSLPTGFEPVRGDPIGFRVQRLNHSATTAAGVMS